MRSVGSFLADDFPGKHHGVVCRRPLYPGGPAHGFVSSC
jgi:hypothetical protein